MKLNVHIVPVRAKGELRLPDQPLNVSCLISCIPLLLKRDAARHSLKIRVKETGSSPMLSYGSHLMVFAHFEEEFYKRCVYLAASSFTSEDASALMAFVPWEGCNFLKEIAGIQTSIRWAENDTTSTHTVDLYITVAETDAELLQALQEAFAPVAQD